MPSLGEKRILDPANILDRIATFYNKISEYRRLDRFTDVTIKCQDGQTFRCHRAALAAASEYFDTMFSTNFREGRNDSDIHLWNIDGDTFEKILEYAYTGKIIPIDDDNIFPLLFASDFLVIPDIEKHCTHYLTEKNIPMKYVLPIYLMASRLEKKIIKSVTGRFILQHLNHFCQDSEFLKMPYRDLGPVLKHFNTSTKSREQALLNVIFKWVSSLTNLDNDDMKSAFMELTRQVRFEFMLPVEVEEYFNGKFVFWSNREGDVGMPVCPEDFNFMVEEKEPSLHAFFHSNTDEDSFTVYSFRTTDRQAAWSVSYRSSDAIIRMQVVEMDSLLYSLKWTGLEWTFNSSTEIDLRTNQKFLAVPLPLHIAPSSITDPAVYINWSYYSPLFMCSFRHSVYLIGSDETNVPFQCYNTERDSWSIIPNVMSDELRPMRMTCDDDRIYMIMHQEKNDNRPFVFRAYDPRVGRLEALNFPEITSIDDIGENCCLHQNKIYVPSFEEVTDDIHATTFKLAIYEPLADQWDVLNMGTRNLWHDMGGHQLVSNNKRMRLLSESYDEFLVHVLTYDSFEEKWYTNDSHNIAARGNLIGVIAF